MYKQFRFYYLYTILPFALLMLTAFMYREVVWNTIKSNPHPQINYLIFLIAIGGGLLAIHCVVRLMREVRVFSDFISNLNAGTPPAELQKQALECDASSSYVIRMMAVTAYRTISQQEQIALENEVEKAAKRLASHHTLPSFLGGLLVGVGLLGTFIGLLATLDDIAVLISSFSNLDMKSADPIAVFAQMVKRMEAPMHSMGIAFSASMYGLLGSMIIGFMMVSVKKCQGDLVSVMNSEMAQHIERALMKTGFAYSRHGVEAMKDVSIHIAGSGGGKTSDQGNSTDAQTNTDTSNGNAEDNAKKEFEQELENVNKSGQREDIRVLKRLEIRLAEFIKLQEKAVTAEMNDFQKQRGEMLRNLAENTEAANQFRTELQRIGRQLGGILGLLEKGNGDIQNEIRELTIRLADDAAETHRLLNMQVNPPNE